MEIHLIIEITIVLFLLIYFLTNQKIIKLKLIRIFYGSYSYKYINSYKSKYMRSPYSPCINDELVSHCFNFININGEKKMYFTKTEITFGSFPFYSKFTTVKGHRVPNSYNIFKLSDEFTVKITGFKKDIPGVETKEIYFF